MACQLTNQSLFNKSFPFPLPRQEFLLLEEPSFVSVFLFLFVRFCVDRWLFSITLRSPHRIDCFGFALTVDPGFHFRLNIAFFLVLFTLPLSWPLLCQLASSTDVKSLAVFAENVATSRLDRPPLPAFLNSRTMPMLLDKQREI